MTRNDKLLYYRLGQWNLNYQLNLNKSFKGI